MEWLRRANYALPWATVGLLILPDSCAPLRPGADFQGREQPPVVSADRIQTVGVLPAGATVLGRVSAQCRPVPVTPNWQAQRLIDVDCSTERLTAALRERASEAGGDLLGDFGCESRLIHPGSFVVWCRAAVARFRGRQSALAAAARTERIEPAEKSATEAWYILIDFTPLARNSARPSRRRQQLIELPELPVNYVALGELVASCERGCTLAGARNGLLAAAARRGASTIAGTICRVHADGWLCMSTAATYQVDPETTAGAR